MTKSLKNVKNEKCTLKDLEYGEKTENQGKYDPIIAMELVTEAAVGILMRMIPQINVFAVNFQLKILVGLMMLVYMFSPMADKVHVILRDMFVYMERLILMMG